MPWIYLVLIAVVLIVGIGVILLNRRRSAPPSVPPAAPTASIDHPPPGAPGATTEPGSATTAVIESVPMPGTAVEDFVVVEEPVEIEVVEVVEVVEIVEVVEPEVVERPTFRSRMAKARSVLTGAFLGVRGRAGITAETWDDLEEALLRADVGIRVTDALLDPLRERVKAKEITTPDELLAALQAEMTSRLDGADRDLHFEPATAEASGPNVWLFVGVNGVGKTTTIGKVGALQRDEGRSVLMAAGDTFRAAAAEQLGTWAERSGAEMVRGNEGGDPSAVIFDAIERATARSYDLVLADTAGRLHTKTNLMDELRKVRRVAAKGAGRVTEVLLVIDATTGQNGLTQAREFGDATEVTGVVLTKLDGSAKGGIVFAIETELGLPVKLVGLGESIEDLVAFDPRQFVDALFSDN
ncbi:MAG: Signal recognition particle receptor FtsY [Ilumatobacteraceae bacterium]|nr:Signal recognition particle receptor FtsY [Ilumatobacteraceae bacterium]